MDNSSNAAAATNVAPRKEQEQNNNNYSTTTETFFKATDSDQKTVVDRVARKSKDLLADLNNLKGTLPTEVQEVKTAIENLVTQL